MSPVSERVSRTIQNLIPQHWRTLLSHAACQSRMMTVGSKDAFRRQKYGSTWNMRVNSESFVVVVYLMVRPTRRLAIHLVMWSSLCCSPSGTVLLPGTAQLTARDILHRLQSSGARCGVTDESLAPLLDSVAPQCPSLQARVLVSHRRREGWMNFGDLLRCDVTLRSCHVVSFCSTQIQVTACFTS